MELSGLTDKSIDYILSYLETEIHNMTEWEKGFVESIADQWNRRRTLSDKQKITLEQIWDRY
jgi:hypothetical protein